MCGIAGFINFNGHGREITDLIQMLTPIRHRGPDATGVFIDTQVGLGHVRLSIIDLSSGNQPIHNEDSTIWVVYNGEVFNYLELRSDLQKLGHQFYTTSDTEVLVHLYERHGPDMLNRLNGQWAFALWDSKIQRLFISRDRIGIRPVHFASIGNTFVFGSEIKSLFAFEGIQRRIDPVALDQICTFWTTLPGRTFFAGIDELEPGNFLLLDRNSRQIHKYWSIPLGGQSTNEKTDSAQAARRVLDLLTDSVRIRLRADVPVGAYLSGGLDSSGITAIVSNKFNADVQTFGIRFEDDRFDEGEHQSIMVKHLGVRHHEVYASNAAIADAFASTVYHCEKPILRTAPVPLYLLARIVREQGIKVVLTGEGADEFFGGYDIFKEALIRQFWARRPDSAWRGFLIQRLYPDIFRDDRARKSAMSFFKQGIDSVDDPLFSHILRWNNTARIKSFFSGDLSSTLGDYLAMEECRSRLPENFGSWRLLHRAQYLESWIFLSNYLLCSQGDRMGMAHSIEVRMPFLDYRLMEFMGNAPRWWKIHGLDEKHILKKALQPFLPPSITARHKHPYRAPIHKSLLLFLQSEKGKELASDAAIREAGMFDQVKVNALMTKLRSTPAVSETDAMALCMILSAQVVYFAIIRSFPSNLSTITNADVIYDKRVVA